MEKYDPVRMERSTRDQVARAAFLEIQAGRGTRLGGVQISVAHLGRKNVLKMFPGMVDRCKDVGRDLSIEPVDVSPTGHFHMGGVKIDKDCFTAIPGLFVAGEDAGGIHGSNRLGGNGVADSTVFGARAGDAAAKYVTAVKRQKVSERQVELLVNQTMKPFTLEKGENPFQLRKELGVLMWDKVGLVRNGADLKDAIAQLADYEERADRCSVAGVKQYNLAWHEVLNVKNMAQIGRMIAIAAYERTESRGSHYRQDCLFLDNENWYKNIFMIKGQDGPVTVTRDVQFTHVQPEELFGETARAKVAVG
jgi:succinate dehydrogenase / fumarate reductase flavoprotein subunit/fumarate reductase flavoprotein subunit